MPIISANAGADVEYDFADIPVASVALNGSGTPQAGSINSYAWQIIGKPTGSAVAITSASSQNTFATDLDVPGDYVFGLAVTDTGGNASSTDWKTMDDTAVKRVSLALENGTRKLAEKQKGWWSTYSALIDSVDAALGRLAPVPVSVAGGTVSNVSAETELGAQLTLDAPVVDDWVKLEGFATVTVSGADSCILRWRVAPASGDLIADGVILHAVSINASGAVFCELALHVDTIGAVLDGAAVDSTSSFRTSSGMPAGVNAEVQAGVSIDITGDLQIGLTVEDDTSWGASSSVVLAKLLGGRINNRRA